MKDDKKLTYPADYEEESALLASDLQYVREENELLKERNAALLLTLKEYFNETESNTGSERGLAAHIAVARILQKYAAL